jgi:NADH:ubiquinone oxidoreductase subunit 4 (subunit M)
MFGNVSRITKEFEDLTSAEKMVLVPLVILVLVGGIFPQTVLNYSAESVEKLTQLLN